MTSHISAMAKACGEYVSVMRLSDDADALYAAHRLGVSQEQAVALIQEISSARGLNPPTVAFTRKNGNYSWDSNRLGLPPTPLADGDEEWYGRLRLGLVLHEMAHFLGRSEFGHGPAFVDLLDGLVAEVMVGDLSTGPGPSLLVRVAAGPRPGPGDQMSLFDTL